VDVDPAVKALRAHKMPIKVIIMVPTYRAAARFIEKTRDLYPALIYTNVSFVGSTALAGVEAAWAKICGRRHRDPGGAGDRRLFVVRARL